MSCVRKILLNFLGSESRDTSVSKRYKYVRKTHYLRVGFAIGIASNALQELRLLVPRLEQSSASRSQQIGELRFYISRAMRIETTDMKLFRIRGQSYKEFLVYANEKTKILKILQRASSIISRY